MKHPRSARLGVVALGIGSLLAPAVAVTTGAPLPFVSPAATANAAALPPATGSIPTPEDFFGFQMGAEGRLVDYDKVLDYFRLIADESDRVSYQAVGPTTMGNEYATVFISSPENLERLDEIVELNARLADPRNTTPEEARELAARSVPIHHVEATIHSSEMGNGQAINDIVHRLATEDSDFTDLVLSNSVIMLVPSQNPDGQKLLVEHFDRTAGTGLARTYPDLYHKYTGHDNNRDWTMQTQVEARYRVELVKKYHPVAVHIMHQQGNSGERIFLPPYGGITHPNTPATANFHASAIGQHASRALAADGKKGVGHSDYHIWWTLEQPVGFFPFTGAAPYLSEIASVVDYAYPQVSKDGSPLGPQQARQTLPEPYDKDTWTFRDIVEYANIAAYAGMEYTAQNAEELLYDNLYGVPAKYLAEGAPSGVYAYVVDAEQRDPYATYEMLQRLEWTDVEIERATSAFTAAGKRYPAGSWVIRTAQPLGNWADQILGVDVYPEVRDCDTCPVMVPYAEATSSLPLQLGVDVAEVREKFSAQLERVTKVEVPKVTMPPAPPNGKGVYLVTPESYGTIQIATALQKSNIFTWRAAEDFKLQGSSYPAGTYVVPATPQARSVLSKAAPAVGVPVHAANKAPKVDAVQLKPRTRVGLYRGANNMPGGWDMWLMEEYGVNFEVVGAQDFDHDLNDLYDTIVLSHGMSKSRIVDGLDPQRYDEEYSWAYGVGDEGWAELREFVEDGGTLLAVGSAVGTAKELVNLPITEALPGDRDEFFTGGSLIRNVFDNEAPAGWGMPDEWPVWLYNTQAWHPTDDSAQVVASYPAEGDLLASGYLRGEEHLRGAANVLSFSVGEGTVVTYGSEVTFRSLPRQQFNLLYNMIYAGPGAEVTDKQMQKLTPAFTADGTPVAEKGKGDAPGNGKGKGHEKGNGKGHEKGKGKGHADD